MINTFQNRPQSKALRTQLQKVRPITRNNDQQQAQKCFQMGKQHQNRNDLQKAQKFYLQAIIHNPSHFKSYCNLGLCYKLRGQFPNSIQAYKKSQSINPLDPITNYNLANVYRLIGNYEKSIQLYQLVINLKEKQGIDIKSLYLDSYNNLGISYKNVQNYDRAIQCFEKITKQKPTDSSVRFNLAVCYLKMVKRMARNTKNQNAMLVKQNMSKTKQLFQLVLKSQPKNQVAVMGLIQLRCLLNKETQNLKSCVSDIQKLIQNSQSSGFLRDQGSKIKAYCLNLLAKYQESAEQYRKAIQNKKQQEMKLLAEQKERQKAIQEKQKQQTVKKTQTKLQSVPKPQPNPQPVQTTVQQSIQKPIIPPQPIVPQINLKQLFSTMSSSLLQKITTLMQNQTQSSKQNDLTQTLFSTIETMLQVSSVNKDKKLLQRLNKQLYIVGCSILGEKLTQKQYFTQAYDTYFSYFLQSNTNTSVTKQTLFLQTHRAIASVLTSLGHSQKAIQHYQIISQQFSEEKISDKDPLQQLHSGLAVNYESQGLHEKAIKQFQQAIRLNPSNYILYYNLGYCQHCAGINLQAVKSYQQFLKEIQNDSKLQPQSKQSYILQALISIFICSQGSLQEKLSSCSQVQSRLQQFCNSSLEQALKLIDHSTLMHYYLLACDLYQQVIFESKGQATKQHKEKLFTIYINLLELPNCPDRDQILINCGNLLFEEKQFLGALHFYQKVSKSKSQVYNIIALTLMNVNQHERAVNCMQFALQNDKDNKIYQVNYQIMKWAYGLNVNKDSSLLWAKYPCQCDLQFDSRVQYSKSLINKLTTLIQKQNHQTSPIEQMTTNSMFNQILSDKEQPNLWRQPQALVKHNFIKQNVSNHCLKAHQNKEQVLIQIDTIKQMLITIVHEQQNSKQNLNKNLTLLIQRLHDPQNKQSSNYLNVMEQLLSLFTYVHTKDQTQLNNLKQIFISKLAPIKTHQLIFIDSIIPNPTQYPSKPFTVLYPSIELKLQNILQSLLSWLTQLEDQFVYLSKLVDTIAYKSQLRSPVLVQYNFPYCKNLQNCEKCFKKACFILCKILNIDCKQNFITHKNTQSLIQHKKAVYSAFASKFGKNIENLLIQTPNQQSKSLSFKLSQQTLPLQIEINFSTQNDFEKFLKQLCTQVSAQQPIIDKTSKQLYLTLNKLVRVKCMWKQTDFAEEYISSVIKSPLNLRQSAMEFFDHELLKSWTQEETLKTLLSKIFDLKTFIE